MSCRRTYLFLATLLIASAAGPGSYGAPVSYWECDGDFSDAMGNNDGNWHFLAITMTGNGTTTIKVDNVDISSGLPAVVTPWSTATQYSIGQEYDGSTPSDCWNGLVDDMTVWNRVLSDNDITDLYNGTSPLEIATSETMIAFQEGVDHGYGVYSGTQDTRIFQSNAATNYGADTVLWADARTSATSTDESEALIRFEGLFGNGSGQIPENAEILWAELVLTTPNVTYAAGNGAYLHRLLTDWDESSATWNSSFGGDGIDCDDLEALAEVEVDSGNLGGSAPFATIFDVTDSIKAWQAGETNYGWALIPRGSDGWAFASSEYATLAYRPVLTITYIPEPSTGILLGLGVMVLALLRFGRRRMVA